MQEITRRSFVGVASVVLASTALSATTALADEGAREANPAEDFTFEEVDGVVAITGYVGQAEEVVVPRSVNGTLVGMVWDGAFKDKSAVFYVELPKGVFYIGDFAFEGCISLEEVVLPERLAHIGAHAFDGCSFLEEVDLPDGVVEIGREAFARTSITKVVVPDGVTSLLEGTFPDGCEILRADGSLAEVTSLDDATGLPIVSFGSYLQSGSESEPIEWLILEERADGSLLLLSRYCLTARPYHDKLESITWADCDLRAWLNGEFLETAFSDEEQERIVEQYLVNLDNPVHGTPGCSDTNDMVFLMSLHEIELLFSPSPLRDLYEPRDERNMRLAACPTERAVAEGAKPQKSGRGEGRAAWWTRSPGNTGDSAAIVSFDGNIVVFEETLNVDVNKVRAVRPALVARS